MEGGGSRLEGEGTWGLWLMWLRSRYPVFVLLLDLHFDTKPISQLHLALWCSTEDKERKQKVGYGEDKGCGEGGVKG